MTPEQKREYMKRWWAAHPDYKRTYYLRNRDRLNELERERRKLMDPLKKRDQRSRWRRTNRARNYEQIRAREDAYQRSHPEKMAEIKRRYKVRKRGGSAPHHTIQEWREKLDLLGHVCFYCGEAKPLERDHKIPISRGGTDDIMNILPSCRECNTRKHNRTAKEYLSIA